MSKILAAVKKELHAYLHHAVSLSGHALTATSDASIIAGLTKSFQQKFSIIDYDLEEVPGLDQGDLLQKLRSVGPVFVVTDNDFLPSDLGVDAVIRNALIKDADVLAALLSHPPKTTLKKALVIDDDECSREVISLSLSDQGLNVFGATNGREGLLTAIRERPDVVVTDYTMPEMSGLELLKELRKLGIEVPLKIFCSGEMSAKLMAIATSAGADSCFPKPFNVMKELTPFVMETLRLKNQS